MANKDIDPKLKLISEYLNLKDSSNFVIPEYQRAYSWTIYQCDKLWQDIENYLDSDNVDPYFFGTVILDCSNEDGELHLIDGQQRTTTFLLLIKAMLIRLQEVLKQFKRTEDSEPLEEGLKENRNRAIEILYKADVTIRTEILREWAKTAGRTTLQNKSINEQYKNELSTILEAKTFEEAEHNCYKIPRKQKDNKYTNFFKNFKFFYWKLEEYQESQLNSFASGFLNKCQVIEIRSWQTEQAITMFNSLNSTGLPLSDADIISAKMYSNAGEQRELFNAKWQDIVCKANELSARNIVSLDSILQQYMYIFRAQIKEYIKINEEGNLIVNVTTPGLRKFYTSEHEELLKNPMELCKHLYTIAQLWDEIKDYYEVRLLLKFNDNAKLYLMAYLYRFNPTQLTHDNVAAICELLLRLFAILELVDAGYSSSYFKTFLFAEAIKLVDSQVSMDELCNDFDAHIGKTWTIETLQQEIDEYDKNVLVFLNEYLYAKEKGIAFGFTETVNVEHIMPASGHYIDTIREDANIATMEDFITLVNKLGNKILLEEDINKSIGKEWFKCKKFKSIKSKLGYRDSRYPLAAELSKYPSDVWTKEDINTATEKVATRMVKFIYNTNIQGIK